MRCSVRFHISLRLQQPRQVQVTGRRPPEALRVLCVQSHTSTNYGYCDLSESVFRSEAVRRLFRIPQTPLCV